jgi:predicted nucleotidyltransferase
METMTCEDILRLIGEHSDHLADLGVRELSLFGSYARGDANETSDVDFLVDLERKSFDGYMEVKELLESLLARRVDLVLKTAVKPRLKDAILREAIRAA